MERPICIVAIASIIGIIMGLYLNGIAFFICIILVISIFIMLILYYNQSNSLQIDSNSFKHKINILEKNINNLNYKINILKISLIFLSFTLLFFIYTSHLQNRYEQIYTTYESQEIYIEAQVLSLAEEKEYKYVYQIKVEKINGKKVNNIKFLLNIKKQKDSKILNYGDKIYFKSTYERPGAATNTGGFDYSEYLKTKQISGIVSTNVDEINSIETIKKFSIGKIIQSLKTKIKENLNEILNEEMSRFSCRSNYWRKR